MKLYFSNISYIDCLKYLWIHLVLELFDINIFGAWSNHTRILSIWRTHERMNIWRIHARKSIWSDHAHIFSILMFDVNFALTSLKVRLLTSDCVHLRDIYTMLLLISKEWRTMLKICIYVIDIFSVTQLCKKINNF